MHGQNHIKFGRVHLNRRGRQFSRLLAAEACASAVVMLDTPCSEVVWRVLATYSIRQFPLHFPSRASPCAIRFQMDSTSLFSESKNIKFNSGTTWKTTENCIELIPRMFSYILRETAMLMLITPKNVLTHKEQKQKSFLRNSVLTVIQLTFRYMK